MEAIIKPVNNDTEYDVCYGNITYHIRIIDCKYRNISTYEAALSLKEHLEKLNYEQLLKQLLKRELE